MFGKGGARPVAMKGRSTDVDSSVKYATMRWQPCRTTAMPSGRGGGGDCDFEAPDGKGVCVRGVSGTPSRQARTHRRSEGKVLGSVAIMLPSAGARRAFACLIKPSMPFPLLLVGRDSEVSGVRLV